MADWCRAAFRLAFRLKNRAYFLAGVLGVPLVDDIEERREIAVLLVCTVEAVIDGNEAYVGAGKKHFCVISDLEIISSSCRVS